MSDVQNNTEQPQKRTLSAREEAIAAVERTRNAEFEKETGIHIEDSVGVIDPDIDPEGAAAEAERQRLNALANGNPGGEDAEQARLQQEQEQEQARAQQQAQDEAAQAAAQATARAQAQAGIEPGAKYKFKVNGQEMELTGDEVLRRVQKDVSADVRLEQASATMREAERIRREAEEQQAALQNQQPAARKGNDGVVVDPSVTKEFTSALFKGDEETAAAAFNKAVSSAVAAATADQKGRGTAATPQVDPSEIAAQVRQQIAIDSALEQSKIDYPDLYADPDIEAVAASKIDRMVRGGKPFVDALSEVQTDMATKFGWKKATGTPTTTAQTNRRGEKLARKESLEQPLGGPNVKAASTEEPVQNVSAVIAEIAASRGQQQVVS